MVYTCLVITILALSCQNRIKAEYMIDKGQFMCKEYHENDSIKSIQYLDKDSIPHGANINYYPSGRIKSEGTVMDGKYYGAYYHYYDDLDTIILKDNGEYFKGYLPKIKQYAFFNDLGNIVFEWKYEHSGEVISTFGKAVAEYYAPDSVKAGDSVLLQFFVPAPPKSENEAYFGKYVNNHLQIKPIKIEDNFAKYQLSETDAGDHNFVFISTIKSESGHSISDTLNFSVQMY